MKILLSVLAALVILPFSAGAYQGDYGTESIFASGAGSRAEAMGGAFSAVADDLSAIYYNPAGLALTQRQTASFLHYPMYEGSVYDGLSYCLPVADLGAFAAAVYRFSAGSAAGYDASDKSTGDFGSEEYKFTVSYSGKISDVLYAGLNADIFTMALAGSSATGFGADAGILFKPFDFFSAGFTVHNIIKPDFSMKNSSEGLPQKYTLGAAFKYPVFGFIFLAATDCSAGESEGFKNSSGAEICWADIISIRAGYNDGRGTFGGGIKVSGAQADYSYVTGGTAGGQHKFTVAYSFGPTMAELREARRQALLEEVRVLVDKKMAAGMAEKSAGYYAQSYALYMAGDMEGALVEAERAVDWNPGNASAVKMKAFVEGKLKEKLYTGADNTIRSGNNRYFDAGVDLYIRKKYAAALSEWEKALKADPSSAVIKYYVKKAGLKAGVNQGQPEISPAVKEASEKIYYEAVNAYTAGDLDKAVTLWSRVLAMDPENTKTLRNIEKAQAEIDELKIRGVK